MLRVYNVFNININRLAQWLIPTRLRMPVLMAIVSAIVSPLISLHNLFLSYRKAKFYQIAMNYQTCYLEAFLNDRFDYTQRRIYIEDAETVDPLYLYMRAEESPVYIYSRSEAQPVHVYTRGETLGDLTYDFIVWVPLDVVFDQNEMRAMIATKLCGKRYKIELF